MKEVIDVGSRPYVFDTNRRLYINWQAACTLLFYEPGLSKVRRLDWPRWQRMKKIVTILCASGLLAVAFCCAIAGYRNYRLYVISHGTSEASIQIDSPGSCVVTVDPPGRSLFRPGGVLEIFVSRNGSPVLLGGIAQGRGNIRVTDRTGDLCLECSLDWLSAPYPNHGQYTLLREFDTSHGGPYRVEFDITEPIRGLEGTSQRLVARHFICGEEPLIHFLQFGAAGLCGAASLFLFWRLRTANKPLQESKNPSISSEV